MTGGTARELNPLKVIVGIPDSTADIEKAAITPIALDVAHEGCDVTLLATNPAARVSEAGTMPVHYLHSRPEDGLAEYWLELIRFLEESAPCLYLSSASERAGWIYPRLSDRVLVVPVLFDDDKAAYDHCRILGKYCNAVIAFDPYLRQRILANLPDLAPRLVRISPESAGAGIMAMAQKLSTEVARGRYRRASGRVSVPSQFLDAMGGSQTVWPAASVVSRTPMWPNPARSNGLVPARRTNSVKRRLVDYRIVVGVTSGRISGVDIFSSNLVRALCARGYRAQILQTEAPERTPDPLPLAEDLPVDRLGLPKHASWKRRWASLKSYLEKEPTIYIPNYDEKHSCVAPALDDNVRVVGIAHSDDPQHYQHILRLAPYWDAVVAVSNAIAGTLEQIAPAISERVSIIPYGVVVTPEPVQSLREAGSPLRAVYAGRLMQYQKRALDLPRIAAGIHAARVNAEITVVGNGPDAQEFVSRSTSSLVNRTMRWVGSLSNEELIELLRESHVFVLPSAFEGLPVSVLEAMANGCVPVVTAIRSGIPELIRDGENGFVVSVGDVDAIVSRIRTLEADDACRVRMSRSAWQTIRDGYSIDQMASSYILALDRMLDRDYERPRGAIIRPPSLRGLRARLTSLPPFVSKAFWRIVVMLG